MVDGWLYETPPPIILYCIATVTKDQTGVMGGYSHPFYPYWIHPCIVALVEQSPLLSPVVVEAYHSYHLNLTLNVIDKLFFHSFLIL